MFSTGSVKDSHIILGMSTTKALFVPVSRVTHYHDFPVEKAVNQDKFPATVPRLFKYPIIRHKSCCAERLKSRDLGQEEQAAVMSEGLREVGTFALGGRQEQLIKVKTTQVTFVNSVMNVLKDEKSNCLFYLPSFCHQKFWEEAVVLGGRVGDALLKTGAASDHTASLRANSLGKIISELKAKLFMTKAC